MAGYLSIPARRVMVDGTLDRGSIITLALEPQSPPLTPNEEKSSSYETELSMSLAN